MKKWLMGLSKSNRYFVVLLPLIIFAVFIIIFAVTDSTVMLIIAIISLSVGIVFLFFNGQVEQQIKKGKAASEEQAKKQEAEPTIDREQVKKEILSDLNISISVGGKPVGKTSLDTQKSYTIETVTVIDFETANHSFTSACSIGITVIKGTEIVDRQYYLIQPPQNYYTDDSIAIHHITPDDTKDADTFPAVWQKIKHLFENTYLAAHNASFDMGVLKATLNYYNIPQPHFEYVNTIAVSSYAIPQGANVRKSLDARCEYFNIPLDNHHNALADAEAAAQLILCNLAHSKFKSAATFLRSNSSYLKDYDDVKIQEETDFKRYNRVNVNEIAASTAVNEEKDADFNGKTFVITGEFKTMTREQALAVVVQRGGIIKNGVSAKVDILVNADDRISTKTKKAAELQAAGHHIKVVNEEQFMRMLESNDAITL